MRKKPGRWLFWSFWNW